MNEDPHKLAKQIKQLQIATLEQQQASAQVRGETSKMEVMIAKLPEGPDTLPLLIRFSSRIARIQETQATQFRKLNEELAEMFEQLEASHE